MRLFNLYRLSPKNLVLVILWLASVILICAQILNTRPLQDDYFLLGYLSENSWLDFITAVWNGQGGNLWIYGAQAILLSNSLFTTNFMVIALWTVVTLSLTSFCVFQILTWVLGADLNSLKAMKFFTVISISYLGFEGLFTPGLISAYSYHQAAFSHLWPIALLCIALLMIFKGSKNIFMAIILGLLVGNSNIAEAWTAFVALFILFFSERKTSRFVLNGFKFFYTFSAGVFLGIVLILMSPGFWNRAQNSVGLPTTIEEFSQRFFKSFGSFLADLITHPMLWLVFLIGILFQIDQKYGPEKKLLVYKVKMLITLGIILFTSLVFGGTFGYVSWHQSSGLYQIFIPLFFIVGFYYKTLLNFEIFPRMAPYIAPFIIFSIVAISLRAGIAFSDRANNWDIAYKINYCVIKKDPAAKLIGAEMLYPGFNLGIEDVASWEWMANGYSNWLSNPKFKNDVPCTYK